MTKVRSYSWLKLRCTLLSTIHCRRFPWRPHRRHSLNLLPPSARPQSKFRGRFVDPKAVFLCVAASRFFWGPRPKRCQLGVLLRYPPNREDWKCEDGSFRAWQPNLVFQASGSTHSSGSNFAGLTWHAGDFWKLYWMQLDVFVNHSGFSGTTDASSPYDASHGQSIDGPAAWHVASWETKGNRNNWKSKECVVCSLQILRIQTGWALEPCQWYLQCLLPCLATPWWHRPYTELRLFGAWGGGWVTLLNWWDTRQRKMPRPKLKRPRKKKRKRPKRRRRKKKRHQRIDLLIYWHHVSDVFHISGFGR